MLHVKDNSERLKQELINLRTENKVLFDLIIDLYKWVEKELKKDVIITMIFRTQKEQDYLYRNSESYKKKPFKSPHQFNHAIDIRSWIYTKAEITKITNYLNDKYNNTNYYRWTALAHEVGSNGMHFHLQYYKK